MTTRPVLGPHPFTSEIIVPGLFYLEFATPEAAAESVFRMQEHYEHPTLKGTVFTLGQARELYSQKNDGFTYYNDFLGFNFPGYVVDNFRGGLFHPLTEMEQKILDTVPASLSKYYIIAAGKGDPGTLRHEVCHGMYYLNDAYRRKIDTVFARYERKDFASLRKELKKTYCEEVMQDEMHAYAGCELPSFLQEDMFPKGFRAAIIRIQDKYEIIEE